MIRLVFVDADGTLVGSQGVPDCAWQAVEEARRRGLRLSLSTGRLGRGRTLEFARRLDPRGFHIFQSGAVVLNGEGRVARAWPLPQTPYHRAVDLARAEAVVLEAYAAGGGFFAEREAAELRAHAELIGVDPEFRDLHAVFFEALVVRAQFVAPEDRWRRLREAVEGLGLDLHEATSPATPGIVYASLTAPGVGKLKAARYVAEALGVELEREAAAIGDGKNDLELLRAVRFGVAMGNAPEEVKRAARRVVPPADECGLAEALEAVWRLRP